MARPRAFDIDEVLLLSSKVFATQGYNGTSIDDLVKATGLLRGSLYKAFGSKRNLFVTILSSAFEDFESSPKNLDLLTVALKDLAAEDTEVKKICKLVVGKKHGDFAVLLGNNLLAKIKEK